MSDIAVAIENYRENKKRTKAFRRQTRPESTATDYETTAGIKAFQNAVGYYFEACVFQNLNGGNELQVRQQTATNFFNAVMNKGLTVISGKGTVIFDNPKLQVIKAGIEKAAKSATDPYLKEAGSHVDQMIRALFSKTGDVGADILYGGTKLELKYGGSKSAVDYATLTDTAMFQNRFFHYLAVENEFNIWNYQKDAHKWVAEVSEDYFAKFLRAKGISNQELVNLILTKGGMAPPQDKKMLIALGTGPKASSMEIDIEALVANLEEMDPANITDRIHRGRYELLTNGLKTPIMSLEVEGMTATMDDDDAVKSLRDFSFASYLYHKQIAKRLLDKR